MKKLFVFSDAHSFLTPLKAALDKAGFDPNNEDHWLISCGDLFDRGTESKEMLEFIMSIERKILIKGNHDILLEECCKRGYPEWHDASNGTKRTVQDLGESDLGNSFAKCCKRALSKLIGYKDLLVNYFETEKYIFVHSWIPTTIVYEEGASKPWYQVGKHHTYMEDWREGNEVEWEEAMWGNPFSRADQGLNQTGKTIVFGHWHCSAGHSKLTETKISESESTYEISEFEDDAIWEPCYFKNTIGIDRCTAHTGEVNVLVLEDNFI